MKDKRLYLLLIAISVLACFWWTATTLFIEPPFYKKGSGWDYLRFPLVEPYYAMYVGRYDESDPIGWQIPVDEVEISQKNFRYLSAILNVEKIAIENGVIMVYSAYSRLTLMAGENLEEKELHWFILKPKQAELGFETEEEFRIQLRQYGIDQPRWQEPNTLLQQFNRTGCLDWIPGCE